MIFDKSLERAGLVLVDALLDGARVDVIDGEHGHARQVLLIDAIDHLVGGILVVADHVQQHAAHVLLHRDLLLVLHLDVCCHQPD